MVRHSRKRSKRYRKQRGGAVFTTEQLTTLGNLGFTDEQKKEFAGLLETQAANEPNLPASVISLARIYLQQINPQTGRNRTPREFIDDEIESIVFAFFTRLDGNKVIFTLKCRSTHV